jgi:hypothetical protein
MAALARIFTNPRGRRPDQPLSTGSFARVRQRALVTADLDQGWADQGGLRIGDLRHTMPSGSSASTCPSGPSPSGSATPIRSSPFGYVVLADANGLATAIWLPV